MNKKDDIKSLTICEYCKHKYHDPVILPCGESLCKKHLTELIQATEESHSHIFCYFCGNEHFYDPESSYPRNKVLQKLIELETAKSEIRYDEARKLCDDLRGKLLEVEEIKRSPSEYLTSYFEKMKQEIEWQKNEFHAMAERNKLSLLDTICLCHTECEANLETEKIPPIKIDTHKLEEFLNKKYRYLNETLIKDFYEVESCIHDLKDKKKLVEEQLQELKDVLFIGRVIKFVPKKIVGNHPETFGEIKIVNKL